MKKFFALMLVVAMLSVAGSAMAVTGTANPSTVNMSVGKVATSTVTGVAENDGDITYELSSAPDGAKATLSGNVVTFRPTEAGNFSVVVSVIETYTVDDGASHTTQEDSADVTITVNVTPAEQPTSGDQPGGESSTAEETTQVIVRKKATILRQNTIVVAIISTAARRAASVLTFAETVRSIAEAIVDSALLNRIGLSQALIQLWATKAAQVAQFAQTAINSPEKRAALFPGLPEGTDTTPQDNSQLEEVAGSTNDDADAGTKLAAATDKLGKGRRALSAGGAVRPKKAGTYKFAKNFGPELYKLPIQGDSGKKSGNSTANAFSAADADSTGVAFLDSQGNTTTIIPGDDNSQDIMPGFVTMLVVMQAGEVYEPVVFTTDDALAEAGITSEDQEAKVNEVAYEEETVVVDPDGNETVQEAAPADALAKMTSALGLSAAPTLVPTSALTSATAIKSADAAADRKYAASHDMFIAATYPAVGALVNGAFYAPVTFNTLDAGKTLAASADFEFYPDGLGADAEKAYVAVFTLSGDEVTVPADILGKKGYIAFVVESEVFRAAAKDNIMDRPTVTLALKAADNNGGNGDNNGGNNGGNGDNNGGNNGGNGDNNGGNGDNENAGNILGSSGGGCSAGSAVLALALLGSFILTRKK